MRAKQQGVALITAILVLALAVIAATSISSEHQLFMRRVENSVFGSNAWAYQYAAENWAKTVLRRDLMASGPDDVDVFDHNAEDWAMPLTSMALPVGKISAQLTDEQAKLNINNLLTDDGVDMVCKKRLQRIFSLLAVDPNIVDAIIDWMDPDITPTLPYGAEDQYYNQLASPYLTAGQTIHDISELRLIKGVTAEDYAKLQPYLTALPLRTNVNLNTASAQVLAAIVPDMSVSQAQDFVHIRESEPYQHIQDFISQVVLNNLQLDAEDLAVKSDFFTLSSEVQIEKSYLQQSSLMHRANTRVAVIKRLTGQ